MRAPAALRHALSIVAVLLPVFILPASLEAQDYLSKTGSPTFATNIEIERGSLNLANGNLHLEIPIGTFPQRGSRTLTYKFVYDSRIWQIPAGTSSWQPTNVPNSFGGWRFVSTADPGIVGFNLSTASCGSSQTIQTWQNFTWTDPEGTLHVFPIQTSQNPCTGVNVTSGDAFALDSTGFHMYVTNFTSAVVLAKDGAQLYPSVKDSNGNFFSADANGNLIDTLGRTPVLKTVSGNSIFYDVLNSQGTRSRYTLTLATVNANTSFGQTGISEYSGSYQAVSSIALPDGSSYSFSYDSGTTAGNYGMLTHMTVPTLGSVTYGYTTFQDAYGNMNRWMTTRQPSDTSGTHTWTYTPQVISTCAAGQTGCQQTVTLLNPDSNSIVYTFTLNNGAWNTLTQSYFKSPPTGTVVLTKSTDYDFSNACPSACTGAAYIRVIRHTTTESIPSGSISSKTEYSYDSILYGNVSAAKEWGSYSGAFPAAPDRETDTAFLASTAYVNANILDKPTSTTVKNAAGVQASQQLVTYDSTTLTSITGVAAHDDAGYGTANVTRGNPTVVQDWVSGTTYLTNTTAYDTTGQKLQVTNPRGFIRSYSYADVFFNDNNANPPQSFTPSQPTNAFVTTVTLVNLAGSSTNTYGYYYGSGKSAWEADPNLSHIYHHYIDPLDRETVTYNRLLANGTRGWTLRNYPNTTQVGTYTGITDTTPSTSCTGCRHDRIDMDGFGRTVKNEIVSDPEGTTSTDTVYDQMGRISSQSNPYRATTDPTYGVDTYAYDTLSREISVTHQDGNKLQTFYGTKVGTGVTQLCSTATYGTGFPVLVIDEAGNKRQTWNDGLGRLIEVDEPDSSNALTLATCYQYDANDQVTSIVQGSQTRTRTYDGLTRMTSSTDPESGTTTLFYTTSGGAVCSGEIGNVCRQTDARGITTTYTYNSVDWLISKAYSDTTPTVTYHYEQSSFNGLTITDGGGRMTGMEDGSGTTAWSYDPAGNVITERRTIAGITKTIQYTYNLDNSVASMTYPSGNIISYSYSTVNRPVSVTDSAHSINFASGATYSPHDKLTGAVYGKVTGGFAGITRSRTYNNRLQPAAITDSSTSGTVLSYSYSFNLGAGVNNGNIATITDNVNANRTQTFTYDTLNRIATAQTQATSGSDCWGQSFGYDRFGTLLSAAVTKCTAPSLSLTVNGKNQITNAGFTYDAAGDLQSDGSLNYTWNGEHQLTGAAGVTYQFDALGRRVQKSSGELTWFSPDGKILAETDSAGNLTHEYIYFAGRLIARRDASGAVFYYFSDRLHSGRAMTDANGVVQQASVYFPYGGEQVPTTFDNRKFTGKKRDSETGNDYALQRVYHPNLGRWLSADPVRPHLTNPQSLNRYVYVLGNVLNFTDRSGGDLDTLYDDPGGSFAPEDDGEGGGGPMGDDYPGAGEGFANPNDPNRGQGSPCDGPDDPTCAPGNNPAPPDPVYIPPIIITPPPTPAPPPPQQKPKPKPTPKKPKKPKTRMFGTHYCGPGGEGPTVNKVDEACKAHDQCYDAGGFTMFSNNNPFLSPAQGQALQQCNQALCNAVRKIHGEPGAGRINWWFSNNGFYRCH